MHNRACDILTALPDARVYTTDLVLTELLNSFADGSERMRSSAAGYVDGLFADKNVFVERLTPDAFDAARRLYAKRLDKDWSLTDCHSFHVMWQLGIPSALTSDHHFEQAGFTVLLRS